MKSFNIGKDFSTDPIGRYTTDGDRSGETFREKYLRPILMSLGPSEMLEIIIDDGVESYGSSFLSEGFAGLVKHGYFTSQELLSKIIIKYTNEDFEFFEKKIIEYINNARFNSKVYEPTEL